MKFKTPKNVVFSAMRLARSKKESHHSSRQRPTANSDTYEVAIILSVATLTSSVSLLYYLLFNPTITALPTLTLKSTHQTSSFDKMNLSIAAAAIIAISSNVSPTAVLAGNAGKHASKSHKTTKAKAVKAHASLSYGSGSYSMSYGSPICPCLSGLAKWPTR